MSRTSRRAVASMFVGFALVVGACGSSGKSSSSSPATNASQSAPTTASKLTGSLNVFAAASLTESFTDYKKTLEAANPELSITNNFAGSQALVTQIENGAPADVFASADMKNMQALVDKGLVETPKVFAQNRLEIAVAPGNPKHITSLADLEKPGVTLVLEDPSVPAGNYARQAFTKAGLPAPKSASNELDVKSTLAKLESGDADAVIVYITDVTAAGRKVAGVAIRDNENVIAMYPIAVMKATKNPSAAEAYIKGLIDGPGRPALQSRGFLPPS